MSVFYLAGAPAGHRGRSLVTTNFGLLCPSSWGPQMVSICGLRRMVYQRTRMLSG